MWYYHTGAPLYKGQVGISSLSTRDKLETGPLSLIQWSLFTRDKLGTGPLIVPYTQWSLSTRDKLGTGPLSLIQRSLSTRDKLGTGPLSLIQWSLSTRDNSTLKVVLLRIANVLCSEVVPEVPYTYTTAGPTVPWDQSKCPDYWGVLISGVNLYYKAYFGTLQSGQNTGVATFQGLCFEGVHCKCLLGNSFISL